MTLVEQTRLSLVDYNRQDGCLCLLAFYRALGSQRRQSYRIGSLCGLASYHCNYDAHPRVNHLRRPPLQTSTARRDSRTTRKKSAHAQQLIMSQDSKVSCIRVL